MQARLARGETVIYHPPGGGKSQVFSKPSDLPSEGDLAKGDPAAEAAALAKIDAEIANKLAERARLLTTAGPVASAPAPAGESTPAESAPAGKGKKRSAPAIETPDKGNDNKPDGEGKPPEQP
jgi:hypothetical protein